MPLTFYKLLHLIAMLSALVALGGLITGPSAGFRKALVAVHGTAMLILLVAGFGAHAKLGVDGFPPWLWGKLAIWLVLGGIVVPIRKKPESKGLWLVLVIVLASLSSWLALYKPF